MVFGLILGFIVLTCLKYIKVRSRGNFYEKQGVRKVAGFDSFPFGNIKQLIEYEKKIKPEVIKSGAKPIMPAFSYTVLKNAAVKNDSGEKYDAGKIPLVQLNTAGRLTLFVADPIVI